MRVVKTAILSILGGISLFIAMIGGFALIEFRLEPYSDRRQINTLCALLALLLGSFFFLLCGKKLHQPLYILVPTSFIIAFEFGNLIGLFGKELNFIILICLFPIITLKLVEKYYYKR